jgi:hypothetical protein
MFSLKDIKPFFDKINIRGHGFNKISLLKISNETHFNSEKPSKEER